MSDAVAEAVDEKPNDDEPKGKSSQGKEAPTLAQRAVYRWSAITLVMAALLVLYSQHPYYQGAQFAPFRPFYFAGFIAWLVLGVFYCMNTLKRFSGMRYTMRDGGLHLVILGRALTKRRFWHYAKKPRFRTTILGICVKGFFTPLMTGFLSGHINSVARAWLARKHLAPFDVKIPQGTNALGAVSMWWNQVSARIGDFLPNGSDVVGLVTPWTWTKADFSWGLGFAYDMIFVVDCGFALIGYATESRWMGNKTRSVEPTAFGWAVCIFCYPPFNNILGTYLPLPSGPRIVTSENVQLAFRAMTVLLFGVYAAATVAFGFKFSNLTNRGIVSRGPYRFFRHPAYVCKCSAWWLEHIPTLTFAKAIFLTGLCGVYALRAWTEERHLSQDPDYVAYKKKVPYVLIPGIY